MAKKPVSKKKAAPATRKAAAVAKIAKKPVRKPAPPKAPPAGIQGGKIVKKLKSPMSKAELTEFRQLLVDKRRAIIGDMSGIEAEALRNSRQDGAGDLSNMPTHPADIGTDNFEQEFTLGLLESERTLLAEINSALERIDNGTYGVCLGTGQPIGSARLRARPWAKYCIEYARMLEKGLVQPQDEKHEGHPDDEDAPHQAEEADEEEEYVEEDAED